MKLRYKITGGILLVLVLAVSALALAISHDSPCGSAPAIASDAKLMKAVVYRCYGPPDVLKVEDIEKPTPKDNQVLVKVRAASVNPLDWHYMRGKPYFMRMMAGYGARQRTHAWALILRERLKRWAQRSHGSSPVMRYSAGERGPSASMSRFARIGRWC